MIPATIYRKDPITRWWYWYWIELGNNDDWDYMWEWPDCWFSRKEGHC